MESLRSIDSVQIAACAINLLFLLTIVSAIVLLLVRFVYQHKPLARYFICLTALLCMLFSPIVVVLQDQMNLGLVTVPLAKSRNISRMIPNNVTLLRDNKIALNAFRAFRMRSADAFVGIFFCLWAGGTGWGMGHLVQGRRSIIRMARDMEPWNADTHPEALTGFDRILGKAIPPIYISSHVTSPVAIGIVRPIVILPEGLSEALTTRQLRQVLLHECGHIVHRHLLYGFVERIVRALFWPHPLIHLLCRELGRAREEVCDNMAAQEEGAISYARTLFAMAQGTCYGAKVTAGLALLGTDNSLEQRIAGLLDKRRNLMLRMKNGDLLLIAGSTILVMGLITAALRVTATERRVETRPVRDVLKITLAVSKDAEDIQNQQERLKLALMRQAEADEVMRQAMKERARMEMDMRRMMEDQERAKAEQARAEAEQVRAEAEQMRAMQEQAVIIADRRVQMDAERQKIEQLTRMAAEKAKALDIVRLQAGTKDALTR